jgi:hypothetical protein
MIYLAGGSTSSSETSSNFSSFDLKSHSFSNLSNLPQSTKFGQLVPFKDFFFLVGGITFEPLSGKKQSSHLMRYSKSSNIWEVLTLQEKNPSNKNVGLTEIFHPGFFLLKQKIFIFGGFLRKGNLREANPKIISFDLNSKNLKIKKENLKFRLDLYKPLCVTWKKEVFIAAGKFIDSTPNFLVYVLAKKNLSVIMTLNTRIEENYPVQICQNFLIFPAFPRFYLKTEENNDWIPFDVSDHLEVPKTEKILKKVKNSTDPPNENFKNNSESPEILSQETVRSSITEFPALFDKVFENPEPFTLPLKKAIKILELTKEKLAKKKTNALEINEILNRLEFKKEVTTDDLKLEFSLILEEKTYPMADIVIFYRSVHLPLCCRQVKSFIFLELLRKFSIDPSSSLIPGDLLPDFLFKMLNSILIFSNYPLPSSINNGKKGASRYRVERNLCVVPFTSRRVRSFRRAKVLTFFKTSAKEPADAAAIIIAAVINADSSDYLASGGCKFH